MKWLIPFASFILCLWLIDAGVKTLGTDTRLWIYIGLVSIGFFALGMSLMLVALTKEYWDDKTPR